MRDRAQNSARGRSAKAAGDRFEAWIENQHEAARMLGIIACVEHNEPHAKVVGGRLIYTKPGVADYTGVLDRTGRAFAVEAKSTKDDRLAKSAVSPEQQKYLDAAARAGALALLLVEFRWMVGFGSGSSVTEALKRYAVPWLEVPWETLRTAESVDYVALSDWQIMSETCYLERFHPRGTPTTQPRKRVYARE